ncbi:rhamnulokinase [Winogradskya consettensis]|uniref:Carbohydrate kinase n=1 Tax=Winogradskya consettensis TaxID=113560 RepID=A0A919VIF2_9ACTN|nr:rhamnulokinase family protein [Actinoplanes consettensis]GIM66957.1 carbohydrate kinase [Actinoplanes consettensis]
MTRFAAVDLGASSGRVMVGEVGPGELTLTEAHRFVNEPVSVGGTLHWDILALYRGVLEGLRRAGPVDAIGIDSWAVDYGLLDESGALLGNPIHYRDARTDGVAAQVGELIPEPELYAATGLQKLPFNTIYQLVAAAGSPQLGAARQMLLIPDLLAYWLTGVAGAEVTNASTTQLLDLRSGEWATGLMKRVGIDPGLFAPLRAPGSVIGRVLPAAGIGTPEVIAVGSHDTASAVVGVPAVDDDFAYISCGTWSLVGVELDAPVLSEASRRANFTNEGGVDGTIRYLRNVMGLWPLQECLREWPDSDISDLLEAAARLEPRALLVDLDDPVFLAPGDMAERLSGQIGRKLTRVETVRCIVDSLALAHRKAIRQASELSGKPVGAVHVVGGGARNELLCQLTADACGLPVLAGPVEATALGNVLVQARAAGAISGDLRALRALVRQTQHIVRYEPRGDEAAWQAVERRWGG